VFVIARGLPVTSDLIAIKSEFVSAVTHELKTPLSLMRLVADPDPARPLRSHRAVVSRATLPPLAFELRFLAQRDWRRMTIATVKRVSSF